MSAPFVVAIGGTTRPGSSTEKALRRLCDAAEARGATTRLFSGPALDIPMYRPDVPDRDARTRALIEAVRAADGLAIGSPGYHGGVSGLVKNVLDYTEDLRGDPRCYLDGRAVGCIGTGGGWQGAGAALTGLRVIVHALRGWNTPIGITVNTAQPAFGDDGRCLDPRLDEQFELMAEQIVEFARLRTAGRDAQPSPRVPTTSMP